MQGWPCWPPREVGWSFPFRYGGWKKAGGGDPRVNSESSVSPVVAVFHAALQATAGFARAFHVENSVLLTGQLVIIDEKLFEFLYEFLAQVAHVLHVGVTVICALDGHDAVVPFFVFFLSLLAFNYSDHAAFQQAARKCRLVHKDQHIERIAIIGLCGRNKAEVIGERHPGGQDSLQRKNFQFRIEHVLVAASLRRFDDYLDQIVVIFNYRLEPGWVGKCILRNLFFAHGSSFVAYLSLAICSGLISCRR